MTTLPLALLSLLPLAAAWSPSAFTGRALSTASVPSRRTNRQNRHKQQLSMYDGPSHNAWSVLSTTEEWISATLAESAANPYTRKEVSYICEPSAEPSLILAGLFRRLKDAREQGQEHGRQQQSSSSEPSTLRQTSVVVVPENELLSDDFATFDRLVQTINQSRRQARDYVLSIHEDDDDDAWSVSVNLAHLHPNYGEVVTNDDDDEDEDPAYKEYKEKRLKARQSPYPTIVIEVRAMPPPDFGESPPPSATTATDDVSSDDVRKLEALFGMSAHHPAEELSTTQQEDNFYDQIGKSMDQAVRSASPMVLAQEWVSRRWPQAQPTAAFTESDAVHVDAAYEFVFVNLAMLLESRQSSQQFLVLPNFLTAAATSLEKFTGQVSQMLQLWPQLRDIQVSTFHPEHIDPDRRAPVPMVLLEQQQQN